MDIVVGLLMLVVVEEILMDGLGQVKVFINLGGNLMMVWFDQILVYEVMKKFELFVCIDFFYIVIVEFVDYVIVFKFMFEVVGMIVF